LPLSVGLNLEWERTRLCSVKNLPHDDNDDDDDDFMMIIMQAYLYPLKS